MEKFLNNPDNEFHKLDQFDKRLFLDLLEKEEKVIEMWIDYVVTEYSRKGIKVDAYRFKAEVRKFKEFISEEDTSTSQVE